MILDEGMLRSSIATFKADGKLGWHDGEYLEEALRASAARDAGEFTSLEEARFEETWGGEESHDYSD
jgi:hypothetical protein